MIAFVAYIALYSDFMASGIRSQISYTYVVPNHCNYIAMTLEQCFKLIYSLKQDLQVRTYVCCTYSYAYVCIYNKTVWPRLLLYLVTNTLNNSHAYTLLPFKPYLYVNSLML